MKLNSNNRAKEVKWGKFISSIKIKRTNK